MPVAEHKWGLIPENDLPSGWNDSTGHTRVSSTVADLDGHFENGYWSVQVWRNVEEGGSYGEPEDNQNWCVELHSTSKQGVIDGWYFSSKVSAYMKALELMESH